MGSRLGLHALLQDLIGSRPDGGKNVYFQPPESVNMNYPCIRYSLNRVDTKFANDKPYNHQVQYQVMIIDDDPDSIIPSKVSELPRCSFDRNYTANNLNHYVYNIYY